MMRNAIFDIQAFADLTNELMSKSPDRASRCNGSVQCLLHACQYAYPVV